MLHTISDTSLQGAVVGNETMETNERSSLPVFHFTDHTKSEITDN